MGETERKSTSMYEGLSGLKSLGLAVAAVPLLVVVLAMVAVAAALS